VTSASRTLLSLVLDRTRNRYIQIQVNEGAWSERVFIDLVPRMVSSQHNNETSIVNSSRGARVTSSRPLWTETRTSRGVKIVNNIYIDP